MYVHVLYVMSEAPDLSLLGGCHTYFVNMSVEFCIDHVYVIVKTGKHENNIGICLVDRPQAL